VIKEQKDRVKSAIEDIENQVNSSGAPDPVRRRKAILSNKPHMEAAIKQLQTLAIEMTSEGESTKEVDKEIKRNDDFIKKYMKEALGYDPTLTPTKAKKAKGKGPDASPDEVEEEPDMPF
jgi:hypothetical protein